jgi:hypothetical protein
MSRTYDAKYFLEDLEVPENLLEFVMDAPRLLPGECVEDYYALIEAMITEIFPDLDLEWFLMIDLAWIFWEIQRYRRWKNAIIAMGKRSALEDSLIKSDPTYSLHQDSLVVRGTIRMKVDSLDGDWTKDQDVAAQLAQYGYDDDALNATAFLQSIPSLAMIEKFLANARAQFSTILRETAVRREFKLRANRLQSLLRADELKARRIESQATTVT